MSRKNILVLAIIALAFLLRFVALGNIPAGFNQDEASQGYAAYSLLRTGHDEWGMAWPVTAFRSFLDYKAPLMTYLIMPSVAISGLNEFAVRLPSALVGSLSVLAIYLLASELFKSKFRSSAELSPASHAGKKRSLMPNEALGLIAAFFFAISPWSIEFSRSAMEANLVSLFFPLALYFFLKSFTHPKYIIFASLFFGLNLYAYHSQKIFIPLFIAGLFLIYFKKIIKIPKIYLISAVILLGLILLPIGFNTLFGQAGRRGSELLVTNLNALQIKQIADSQYYSPLSRINPLFSKALNNKAVFALNHFVDNYLSYFSPGLWFVFGSGDTSYANLPGTGLMYFWALPLVILGLFILVKDHISKKETKVIFLWLILAALPAAITKDGSHANRAVAFMALPEIIAAFAIIYLIEKNFFRSIVIRSMGFLIILVFAIFFLNRYLFNYNVEYPTAMSYGWADAIKEAVVLSSQYRVVHLQERYELQSFVAFYSMMNPEEFQQASRIWWQDTLKYPNTLYLDQLPQIYLGKFQIKSFNWPADIDKDTLYVALANTNLPEKRHTLQIIKAVTQEPLVEIFDFRNVQ